MKLNTNILIKYGNDNRNKQTEHTEQHSTVAAQFHFDSQLTAQHSNSQRWGFNILTLHKYIYIKILYINT